MAQATLPWPALGQNAMVAAAAGRRRLATTLAAVITSTTGLAALPGNVFLPRAASGLPRDSVVNVTALVTVGKADLGPGGRRLPAALMDEVDQGLRRVLGV